MLISFSPYRRIIYCCWSLTVRLMGKRQIGEMEPAEFVVTMLLANLAAIPMQDSAIPLLSGLVPILVILGLELILAVVTMRSIRMRRLLCGKPVILDAKTGKFSNGICKQHAREPRRADHAPAGEGYF